MSDDGMMNNDNYGAVDNTETNSYSQTEEIPGYSNIYGGYSGTDMNSSQNPVYQYEPQMYEGNTGGDGSGMCIAAFVLGIVAFLINPIYICSILAIVFGAIGKGKGGVKANFGLVGLILGIVSICLQFCGDIALTIGTGGVGIFTCMC